MVSYWERVQENFWKRVTIDGPWDCWEWQGYRDLKGYGVFHAFNRPFRAHRAAFELWHQRPIGAGLLIRHLCDNTSCVNPCHLMEGTAKENKADSVRQGRHAHGDRHGWRLHPEMVPKGERNHRTGKPELSRGGQNGRCKLSVEAVKEIRRLRTEEKVLLRELAQRFRVSQPTIEAILYRHNWDWLE